MLDQILEFLFDNYAVAGLQFENWMWVIGAPALLILGYFFERGFHWNTGDARGDPPVDNLRDRRRPDDSGKPAGAASTPSFDWRPPQNVSSGVPRSLTPTPYGIHQDRFAPARSAFEGALFEARSLRRDACNPHVFAAYRTRTACD